MSIAVSALAVTGATSAPARAKTFYFNTTAYDYTINDGSVALNSNNGVLMKITGSFDYTGNNLGNVAFSNVNLTFELADYIASDQQNGTPTVFTYTAGAIGAYNEGVNRSQLFLWDSNNIKNDISDRGVKFTIEGNLTDATTSVSIANATANDQFCTNIGVDLGARNGNSVLGNCTGQKNNITAISGTIQDTLPVPSPAIGLGLAPIGALALRRRSQARMLAKS